jgi:hypothetical protein
MEETVRAKNGKHQTEYVPAERGREASLAQDWLRT